MMSGVSTYHLLHGLKQEKSLWYISKRLIIPHVKHVQKTLFHLAHDVLGHFGFDTVLYPPWVIPCGIHGRGDGLQKFQMDSMEWCMDSIEWWMDSMVFSHGFHTFSRWIPWNFQMDSIWNEFIES